MEKDVADFAVKELEKNGCSYCEARLEESNSNSFVLKNGVSDMASFNKVTGLGLRFLINSTLGFVSINDLNKDSINRLIKKAVRITKAAGRIKEDTKLAEAKVYKKNYSVKEKIKINSLDASDKLKILLDLEKEINKLKIKVPGRFLNLSDSIVEKYFVNSEGSQIYSKIPYLDFYHFLTLVEGDQSIQRFCQYGRTGGYEAFRTWKLKKTVIEELKALQKNLKFGVNVHPGKMDVIVGSEVTGIIVHEAGGHPYEADRIFGREAAQAGESFLSPKMIGDKISHECVNVVDNPLLENGFGHYLFDDEGVKAEKKYLIKKGLINSFLHNRETAFQMGVKSNGSARASDFDKEAIVRMSNTYIEPGTHSKEELIEDIKNGVLIESFMEWNIDDLRLNQKYVGSEAHLIKNGKIIAPVKRPAIEITTPKLYGSIDAVGKKFKLFGGSCGKGEPMQGIPVSMGGPYVRMRDIMVH